jgi:hypothetical protein
MTDGKVVPSVPLDGKVVPSVPSDGHIPSDGMIKIH